MRKITFVLLLSSACRGAEFSSAGALFDPVDGDAGEADSSSLTDAGGAERVDVDARSDAGGDASSSDGGVAWCCVYAGGAKKASCAEMFGCFPHGANVAQLCSTPNVCAGGERCVLADGTTYGTIAVCP